MIIAIDIGNTNIVIGCADGNRIVFSERVETNVSKTELEYLATMDALFGLYGISKSDINGAIIASVVPQLNWIIRMSVKKYLDIDPIIVGPGVKTGLNILMDNPAQVGADLIANAVAGITEYGSPLIIVDMGTATTLSVLDTKGCYIGGMIVPGVGASLESLRNTTSQLPSISIEAPKKVIGRNTIDSMRSGVINGQSSMIDGLIDRIIGELGYEARVIATGGMCRDIIPQCKHEITVDNNLTLKGLVCIYNKNFENR